jgi:hypothetical protein
VVHYSLKEFDEPVDPRLCVIATGPLKPLWLDALEGGDETTTISPILQRSTTARRGETENAVSSEPLTGEKRRCANFDTCGNLVPSKTPNGRKTRHDRKLCDPCKVERDTKVKMKVGKGFGGPLLQHED